MAKADSTRPGKQSKEDAKRQRKREYQKRYYLKNKNLLMYYSNQWCLTLTL